MNLDRNANHGVPRVGKAPSGVSPMGQHGWGGAAAVGGGGFLSVLATLDVSETSDAGQSLDPSTLLTSLTGGIDVPPLAPSVVVQSLLPLVPTVEPQLPDAQQLAPDVGWQVDTAALLAHKGWAAQLEAAPQVAVPAGVSAMPSPITPSGFELEIRSDTAGQALPAAPPAIVLSPVAFNLGLESLAEPLAQTEIDIVAPPVGPQEGAKRSAIERDAEPRLPLGVQQRLSSINLTVQADTHLGPSGSGVVSSTSPDLRTEVRPDTASLRWASAQRLTEPGDPAFVRVAAAPSGAALAAGDMRARHAAVVPDVAALASSGPSATVLMGLSEGVTKRTEPAATKPSGSFSGSPAEGLLGAFPLGAGRPVEAAAAADHGALPTPEMMVAEQVSYWIADKVQNAELRLEVFGRTPVQVSISMEGSAAQVEFRTDQPEIRQVLEGAVAHLKDLLKDEGLSLAGVFVGSSGQRRQDAQDRPEQAGKLGARQARVELPLLGSTGHASGQRLAAGRTVDLFV